MSNALTTDIARRVKAAAKSKSLSARAVSMKAGLSPDYVSKMERRGSAPDLDKLAALSSALDVPLEHFFADGLQTVSVPMYEVRAAAGDGALVAEEQMTGKLTFDRSYLQTLTGATPDQLSIIQAWGDSMEPAIPENAWVMIDRSQRKPINRGIYAFRQDDDARLKRFLIHPTTGGITLHSDNPAWEDIEVPNPEVLQILGRVIWYGKKMI